VSALHKLPFSGAGAEVPFSPRQNGFRSQAEDRHWHGHANEVHLVFAVIGCVDELIEFYDFDTAFKDDRLVATVDVDRHGRVRFQVTCFVGGRIGGEVKGAGRPDSPDGRGVRTAVGTGGADPIVVRFCQSSFGEGLGDELHLRPRRRVVGGHVGADGSGNLLGSVSGSTHKFQTFLPLQTDCTDFRGFF